MTLHHLIDSQVNSTPISEIKVAKLCLFGCSLLLTVLHRWALRVYWFRPWALPYHKASRDSDKSSAAWNEAAGLTSETKLVQLICLSKLHKSQFCKKEDTPHFKHGLPNSANQK